MAYSAKNPTCAFCESGPLLFRRSASKHLIFLFCYECDTVYLNPKNICFEASLHPWDDTNWQIPGTSEFVFGGDSDWATEEEITNLGWEYKSTGDWQPIQINFKNFE